MYTWTHKTGHQEPFNEIGFLNLSQHPEGFILETFCFINSLGHLSQIYTKMMFESNKMMFVTFKLF